jgi:hypothetical protein
MPKAMVVASLSAGRGRHDTIIGRFPHAAQPSTTIERLSRREDNSRRKVQNVHADSLAGLPFRRAVDGATFHTLRHTAASLLAELGEPEAIRKEVMGHRNIATTQRDTHYTHLRPVHEIPAHERLADAVPIADLVTAARKRASGKAAGKNAGTPTAPLDETQDPAQSTIVEGVTP